MRFFSVVAAIVASVAAIGGLLVPRAELMAAAAPVKDSPASMRDIGRVSSNDTRVSALAVGADGRVFVGTSDRGQLFVYDPATEAMNGAGQAVPGGTMIKSMVTGSDGLVFGGTTNNAFLFVYSVTDNAITQPGQVVVNESDLLSLLAASDGAVFGGTGPNAHLMRFNPRDGTAPQDLGQPVVGETAIAGLTQTVDGLIWAVTAPGGFLVGLRPGAPAIQVWERLEATPVSLVSSGNTVYVGTANGDLLSFSLASGLVRLGQPVAGERSIVSLTADSNGNVYGGTYPGGHLFAFEPMQSKYRILGQPVPGESAVSALAFGLNGLLYAGTSPQGHLAEIALAPLDTTPPEASIEFDASARDIVVFGLDSNAVPGPAPFRSQKEPGQREKRTYQVLDKASNSLALEMSIQRAEHELKAELVSLSYNGQGTLVPAGNKVKFAWDAREDGSLARLDQEVNIEGVVEAEAEFVAGDGATHISVEYSGKGKTELTLPGLVTLKLRTDKGTVSLNY